MYNNTELDRRLSSVSNDSNETWYLFQRISVALQRSNTAFARLFSRQHTRPVAILSFFIFYLLLALWFFTP